MGEKLVVQPKKRMLEEFGNYPSLPVKMELSICTVSQEFSYNPPWGYSLYYAI